MRTDPGLTIFAGCAHLENDATSCAVTWKKANTWRGRKTHMGWLRMTSVRPSSTHSAPRSLTSRPRSGGVHSTRASMETRWLTSGRNSPPMSRTFMEWSGSASPTHVARSGRDASPSRAPWPTSNAVPQKRNGRMRKTGWRRRSARRATASIHVPAKNRSQTPQWHAPTSASPRVSTSSRPVTALLANFTSTGPRGAQTPRAGGASI